MANFTPIRRKIFNQLDEWGVFFDTPRLAEEENRNYKIRLLDVMAHRANSTYLGLIYGISRDLGQDLYEAATISYTGTGKNWVVEVSDKYLRLYSEYPWNLNHSIDLWKEPTIADPTRLLYLSELNTAVNATGDWHMSLVADGWKKASNLFNQSSRIIIPSEPVAVSPKVQLAHKNITDYNSPSAATIYFTDTEVYNPNQKKTSAAQVLQLGDWYLDADNGTIISFAAAPNAYVRYEYIESHYTLMASPVEIYDITSTNVVDLLFTMETAKGESSPNPTGYTDLGWDVYLELKAASKGTYWGGTD